jgi:hypothetical protein
MSTQQAELAGIGGMFANLDQSIIHGDHLNQSDIHD